MNLTFSCQTTNKSINYNRKTQHISCNKYLFMPTNNLTYMYGKSMKNQILNTCSLPHNTIIITQLRQLLKRIALVKKHEFQFPAHHDKNTIIFQETQVQFHQILLRSIKKSYQYNIYQIMCIQYLDKTVFKAELNLNKILVSPHIRNKFT